MNHEWSPSSERVPELKYAPLAPEVWEALGEVKRTGWVIRGVANPETVQDHIVILRSLATEVSHLLEAGEKEGLHDLLEVHDWPEAIHGDEVIYTYDEEERRRLKEIKFANEKKALEQICSNLGAAGNEIMSLWLRFESSCDPTAHFAQQLDKYQPIERALEYEKEQGIALFEEFYAYNAPRITHPVLVDRLNALQAEWQRLKVA